MPTVASDGIRVTYDIANLFESDSDVEYASDIVFFLPDLEPPKIIRAVRCVTRRGVRKVGTVRWPPPQASCSAGTSSPKLRKLHTSTITSL